MRWRRGRRAARTAFAGFLVCLLPACAPERLRPGPPSVTLEFPGGRAVTSPDTIAIRVLAADPNGLDTVAVAMRELVITLNAFARTEFEDLLVVRVPDSLPPGTLIPVTGTAADLSGLTARVIDTLTVIERGASP